MSWFVVQSGVCLTYLIFVPQNLRKSCKALFQWDDVSTTFFLFLTILVQIPLSWIQEIRHLTVTNALANSLIMYGLITSLGFAFQEAISPVQENQDNDNDMNNADEETDDLQRGPMAELFYKFIHLNSFNSSGWFLFIGTSVS